jgi:hypothetical protein
VEIVAYTRRRTSSARCTRSTARRPPTSGLASTHDADFDEWRIFAIERPSRALDLTFLAIADGRVVGVAYMDRRRPVFPQPHGHPAEVAQTGHRSALKRAQIAGAMAKGVSGS